MSRQKGMSLIELMVAVGILGIISAIALPMYSDYVQTSRQAVMAENIQTIRVFQEEARLSLGAYQAGTYDPGDPDAAAGLKTKIGWYPRTTSDEITYVVDNVSTTSFRVTATHSNGTEVEKTFSR